MLRPVWLSFLASVAAMTATPLGAQQGRSMVPDRLAQSGWTVEAVRRIQAQLAQREDQLAQSEAGRRRAAREAQRGTASLIARLAVRLGGGVRVGDEATLLRRIDEMTSQIAGLDADNQRLRQTYAGTSGLAFVERLEALVADGELDDARAVGEELLAQVDARAAGDADLAAAVAGVDALRLDYGSASANFERAADLTPPSATELRFDRRSRAFEMRYRAARLANDPNAIRAVIASGETLILTMAQSASSTWPDYRLRVAEFLADAFGDLASRGDPVAGRRSVALWNDIVAVSRANRAKWLSAMIGLAHANLSLAAMDEPGAAAAAGGAFVAIVNTTDRDSERHHWVAGMAGRSTAYNVAVRWQPVDVDTERMMRGDLVTLLRDLGPSLSQDQRARLHLAVASHSIRLASAGVALMAESAVYSLEQVLTLQAFEEDPAVRASVQMDLANALYMRAVRGDGTDAQNDLNRAIAIYDEAASVLTATSHAFGNLGLVVNRSRIMIALAQILREPASRARAELALSLAEQRAQAMRHGPSIELLRRHRAALAEIPF